jgi:Putative Na+/H+ antiporter
MKIELINIISAAVFFLAIIHTFSIKFFEKLAIKYKNHEKLFHLLSEVEVVFGFWAAILIIFLCINNSFDYTMKYLEEQDYTEPLFIFVIMVIAASKPILDFCLYSILQISKLVPANRSLVVFFITISFVPLLGSFITEPAAMTLAALLLKDYYFSKKISSNLMYAVIGVLFVNVSIGGTLTPYAAPPILMVADKWDWNLLFMLKTFGWKSSLAVIVNALFITLFYSKELKRLKQDYQRDIKSSKPTIVTIVHVVFLIAVVYCIHHPILFLGLFIFFLGFTHVYNKYQNKLFLREGLLVGFFLAGLIILGGQQKWWLQPLIKNLNSDVMYYGVTILTAITDNAALTYLGSLVDGLTNELKYALVAGAVTGGGLTVIANAPNPAGYSILKNNFPNKTISPLKLFLFAIPPTFVAITFFKFL